MASAGRRKALGWFSGESTWLEKSVGQALGKYTACLNIYRLFTKPLHPALNPAKAPRPHSTTAKNPALDP